MKSSLETARQKLAEMSGGSRGVSSGSKNSNQVESNTDSDIGGNGASPGGFDMAGLMNNPSLAGLMNNPNLMSMASQMMKNPMMAQM